MTKAILSKVLPATDTQGTRVACSFASEGYTIPRKVFAWSYAAGADENHALAARRLLNLQTQRFAVVASAPLERGRWVHLVREVDL
jgi:hypothetical protein